MCAWFRKSWVTACTLVAGLSLASAPGWSQQIRAFIAADTLIGHCAPGPANDPSFCNAYLMGVADTLGEVYLRNCRPLVLEAMVVELFAYVEFVGAAADFAEIPAVNLVRDMIRSRFC